MALAPQEFPAKLKSAFGIDTEKALTTPLGAASPLWLAFGAAASAGVAYWWFTRWLRPANLEAAPVQTAKRLQAVATVDSPAPPLPVIDVAPVLDVSPVTVAEALVDAGEEAATSLAAAEVEAVEAVTPPVAPAQAVEPAPAPAAKAAAHPVASPERVATPATAKKASVKAPPTAPKAAVRRAVKAAPSDAATQKAIADKLVAKRAAAKLATPPKASARPKTPGKRRPR